MILKVRTSISECNIARNRSNIGKKVAERESGKQDELKSEQERRNSEPRAAEKRRKSTERHLDDAGQQPKSVPDVLQERFGEAKGKRTASQMRREEEKHAKNTIFTDMLVSPW